MVDKVIAVVCTVLFALLIAKTIEHDKDIQSTDDRVFSHEKKFNHKIDDLWDAYIVLRREIKELRSQIEETKEHKDT